MDFMYVYIIETIFFYKWTTPAEPFSQDYAKIYSHKVVLTLAQVETSEATYEADHVISTLPSQSKSRSYTSFTLTWHIHV